MRKLIFSILICMLVLLTSATPVSAAAKLNSCIPESEVEHLYLVTMDNPPIPLRSYVEFVRTCSGELAVKWVETLGLGKVTHYYVFGDYMDYSYRQVSRVYTLRTPQEGDAGLLTDYYDFDGPDGHTWEPDGIADHISVQEWVEWSAAEIDLINLGNQFYQDAVDGGWFFFTYPAECAPSSYLLNGKPLQAGPYTNTYKVPDKGGTFEAFYKSDDCSEYFEEGEQAWSYYIMPGDSSYQGYEPSSMQTPDPWDFCYMMERIVPAWQPEYLPSNLWHGECPYLQGQHDSGGYAILTREGFTKIDSAFRAGPADLVKFVYQAGDHTVNPTWPEHTWATVEEIQVGSDTFTVTLDEKAQLPIFTYDQYGHDERQDAWSSDIPVVWGEWDWGDPILFVSNDTLAIFSWKDVVMYRVTLDPAEGIKIEKAVW